ncbi:MAG TPA: T9SS type A sorting domain-containing protein [Ignavibacteria bacterium]
MNFFANSGAALRWEDIGIKDQGLFPLAKLKIIIMKKILLLLFMFCSTLVLSQPAWIEQQTGYSNHSVECVHFFNEQTGIIGGGFGVFARTTNGGINWIHINNNENNHYQSISFINNNTGWISGGFYNYSYVMEIIRKTTDGGLTWDSTYLDIYARVYDIQFINSSTGFMAGKYIKKTTNGGINWSVIDSNIIYSNIALFFLNSATGWASKSYYDQYTYISVSKLLKTTNSGQNWIPQIIDTSSIYTNNCFTDIQFLNENTGYITNTTYGVFKTTNSGQNWFIVDSNTSNYKLFFLNEYTGWIGSWNYIRKTTNGGTNWLSEFLYQGCSFRGMYFINGLTGWTSGMTNVSQPKLFRTTNGGVWVKQTGTEVPAKYSLYQNYSNPFNPTTKIKFDIAPLLRGVGGVLTSLIIFDILGREVTTLVNEKLQPGTYEVTFDGSNLSSGIYFYQLKAEKFQEIRKMVLLK